MKAYQHSTSTLHDFRGIAFLYRLDPPYENHEYVIVSQVHGMFNETLMFPATKEGTVSDWLEIIGWRDAPSHVEFFDRIGYSIFES